MQVSSLCGDPSQAAGPASLTAALLGQLCCALARLARACTLGGHRDWADIAVQGDTLDRLAELLESGR